MTDAAAQEESRKVTDWLLAILRFAVTRNTNDRAAVLIMAGEMDRLGSHAGESTFAYFFRTSCQFCDAFAGNETPETVDALRRHFEKIENVRLRRALQAVLEFERVEGRSSRP
jgi:hypothetical protein